MRVVVLTALLLLALKLQAADLQSAADPPCAAPRSIVGVRTKDGPVPLMRGDAASGFHPACAVRWKVLSPNNQPLVVSACFRDSLLQIDNETACGVVSGRLWIPARWVVTSGVPVTPKTPLTTCHRLETEAYAVTRGLDPACIPKK